MESPKTQNLDNHKRYWIVNLNGTHWIYATRTGHDLNQRLYESVEDFMAVFEKDPEELAFAIASEASLRHLNPGFNQESVQPQSNL